MGKIVKVSGPLVVASGLSEANMADVVRVGEQHLIGEILTMSGDSAAIQVYEETSGLGPGAEVVTTGAPLSVELGPGLIENIYDGIQRPLEVIRQKTGGNFLPRGEEVPALDREKKWDFTAVAKVGDHLIGGDVLALGELVDDRIVDNGALFAGKADIGHVLLEIIYRAVFDDDLFRFKLMVSAADAFADVLFAIHDHGKTPQLQKF